MTNSINKVILVGTLGRDPDVRPLRESGTVVNLSVGTTESWFDKKTNEQRERTEWHRVAVFNEHLARFAEQNLKKGARVYVEGQLQTRKWTDQATGQEKSQTEIVIARGRGELAWVDAPLDSIPSAPDAGEGFGGGGGGFNRGPRPDRGDRGGDRSSYAPRGGGERFGGGNRFGGGDRGGFGGGESFSPDRSEKSGGGRGYGRGGDRERGKGRRDFDDE